MLYDFVMPFSGVVLLIGKIMLTLWDKNSKAISNEIHSSKQDAS